MKTETKALIKMLAKTPDKLQFNDVAKNLFLILGRHVKFAFSGDEIFFIKSGEYDYWLQRINPDRSYETIARITPSNKNCFKIMFMYNKIGCEQRIKYAHTKFDIEEVRR